MKAKRVSRCTNCPGSLQVPRPKRRKTSKPRKSDFDDSDTSDGAYDIPEAGVMKPDITFFGEKLPNTFFDRLTDEDAQIADLVIVVGTSMKVAPVSEVPNYLPQNVPHICISREPIEHINFDITLLGDCDNVVAELCRRAQWQLRNDMIPTGFKANVEGVDGHESWWMVAPEKKPAQTKVVPLHQNPPAQQALLPARAAQKHPQLGAMVLRYVNKYADSPTVGPYLATHPDTDIAGLKRLRQVLKHDHKARKDLAVLQASLA